MRIAIIGTRGIPNNYGGFEQFAEYISAGLADRGHDVTVYNPHFHPYKESTLNKVHIRPIFCPENKLGSSAHFIYDYLCLKDALRENFDIIYAAGYGTQAPSLHLLRGYKNKLIVNMDGLEWQRSKWNGFTKKIMKYFEGITVKKCNFLVSDNIGIQEYFKQSYEKETYFLAYGATEITSFNPALLDKYNLAVNAFSLLIARLEPENNIDPILQAHKESTSSQQLIVIGNHQTPYGSLLREKYKEVEKIVFLGPVYNKADLDVMRRYCTAYYHGHSVGGTNPSLLEAMATQSFIISHNNPFNKSVLGNNALYFSSKEDLVELINDLPDELRNREIFIQGNLEKIRKDYSWEKLVMQHEELFLQLTR